LPYKDPEKEKERQARRRATPEYQNYQKAYQVENREHIKELARSWYHENIETEREKKRLRKQRERNEDPYYEVCRRLGIDSRLCKLAEILQGNRCAICRLPETARHTNGKVKRLCVDHDHVTGQFRQLLCTRCNKALGVVGDDVELLQLMIGYIQIHLTKEAVTA
jgi:hypothetical protein